MIPIIITLCGCSEEGPGKSGGEALLGKLQDAAKEFKKKFNKALYGIDKDHPTNGIVEFKTYDGTVDIVVEIENGKFQVHEKPKLVEGKVRAIVIFGSEDILEKFLNADLDTGIRMMTTDVWIEGNPAHFAYLSYLLSLLNPKEMEKALADQKEAQKVKTFKAATKAGRPDRDMRQERMSHRLKAKDVDPGVRWLADDPYLSEYSVENFPRLKSMRADYHKKTPKVTSEQGVLLTRFFNKNGYDTKPDGSKWNFALRTAEGFRYLMTRKKALLRKNDLLAGTLTPDPVCGSISTPFTIGWSIWGDLRIMNLRGLEKYEIDDKTIDDLYSVRVQMKHF